MCVLVGGGRAVNRKHHPAARCDLRFGFQSARKIFQITPLRRVMFALKAWSECMGKCNNEFSVKEQFYILLSQGSIRLLLLLLSMSEEDSKSSKGV